MGTRVVKSNFILYFTCRLHDISSDVSGSGFLLLGLAITPYCIGTKVAYINNDCDRPKLDEAGSGIHSVKLLGVLLFAKWAS